VKQRPIFGFPHVSKTGGTTILTILRSTFGTSHCDVESWRGKHGYNFSPKDLRRLLKVYPHLKSVNGHAFRPYEDYEEVYPIRYFAMFREPVSRCISEFQHQREMRNKDWSFEDYIQRVGRNNQTRFICGEPDHEKAIEIIENKKIVCGLLEHFDESLLMFNKLVFDGALNCSYTVKKAAKKNSIRNKLKDDEAAISLIKENNLEDAKLYQYIKTEIYPRQRESYGDSLENELSKFQPKGFNRINIFLNRCYRNSIYKSSLWLLRRGSKSNKSK